MRTLAILVLSSLVATAAYAGDTRNSPGAHGQLIGHDGKRYVMEGCAAYPVTAEAAPKQSRTVASLKMERAPRKLAQSKPVTKTE